MRFALSARLRRREPDQCAGQRGYALLMVVFLAAVMIIVAAAAAPNMLTEGKRAREEEMIWRGEQYKRAIGLFYRKTGRFPTSVDDLMKGNAGIRFLRQPYKDPMNKADGTWRFIYISPGGQLVGSVRYTSLAQMAAAQAQRLGGAPGLAAGGVPGAPGSAASGDQSQQGSNAQGASQNPSGSPQNPAGAQGVQPGAAGPQPGQPGGGVGLPLSGEQPQALDTSSGVMGGSIIGVASTVDTPSIKIYEGGTKYKQWEFIWNPLAVVSIGQIGVRGGGTPGQPGANPSAMPFGGNPTPNPNPSPNPPTPQMPQPPN